MFKKVKPVIQDLNYSRKLGKEDLRKLKEKYKQIVESEAGSHFVTEIEKQVEDKLKHAMRETDKDKRAKLLDEANGMYETVYYFQRMGTVRKDD